MSSSKNITTLLREHKTLFIVITIGIILLEVEIFAFAAMKAGRKSILEIHDQKGNLIHVTDGDNLTTFNKYYFEKTFGPIEQYQVNLVTRERSFPFRAWFTAALGIPVGAVLLFGFIVRAYLAIVHGEQTLEAPDQPTTESTAPQNRLQKIISQTSRLNIFIIGFLVFLAVLAYWIVPNVLTYLGKVGLDTLVRYKWIFLPSMAVLFGVVIWIIYLRYLLAKRSIESQVELNKYRLQLEMAPNGGKPLELDYTPDLSEMDDPAAWTEDKAAETAKGIIPDDSTGESYGR